MYSEGRYFTMTGCCLGGTLPDIEERTSELQVLYLQVFGDAASTGDSGNIPPGNLHPDQSTPDDEGLIQRAMAAQNGLPFSRLWLGDCSGYSSQSEADLALCSLLAFWTKGDVSRMDRLFRRSGLFRPKWDEPHYSGGMTYGQGTLEKSLQSSGSYLSNNGIQWVGGEDVISPADPSPAPRSPALPEGVWTGWLAQYRDWVLPTTDGAVEAMFACASVDLALAIGRQVGVHYGRAMFPNLLVAACGPTGVPRKSTIQSRDNEVRRAAFADDFVRVARSIGSGEGLLERFCQEGSPRGRARRPVPCFSPSPASGCCWTSRSLPT